MGRGGRKIDTDTMNGPEEVDGPNKVSGGSAPLDPFSSPHGLEIDKNELISVGSHFDAGDLP
jgi:hypothetical protein